MMQPNRVAVIGISGSGKSTFSRSIAKNLNLPLHHMDSLYWKSGWEEVAQDVWRALEDDIIVQEKWIIEGYICEDSLERLKRADIIYYLDVSGFRALVNCFTRWLKHRKVARTELMGSPEKLSLKTCWMVLMRRERDEIESVLNKASVRNVVRITSYKEISFLLEQQM